MRRIILLTCMLLAISSTIMLSGDAIAPSPTPASPVEAVEVTIGNIYICAGETATSSIMIKNVSSPGVSAVTINLTYDPSVLKISAVGNSSFDAAVFNINAAVFNINNSFVKIVAFQTGESGIVGDVCVADIKFKAVGKAGDFSTLNISVITLKDNNGASIPYFVRNGSAIIRSIHLLDTGRPRNPYPSIAGCFNGTITPNRTIIATKLYTYACEGTGGHTEYALIWNETWCAEASWKGYENDWTNISFNKTVILMPYETYNITMITGSYPQIHHTNELETDVGKIRCVGFEDVNGRRYEDWIPAFKLYG